MAFICQNFTSAQTDQALVTVSTGQKLRLRRVAVFCSNANSPNVDAQVGFGASTITSLVTRHPGIAPGSGFVDSCEKDMAMGADGEDIRFTCGAPTGGSIQVGVTYDILPLP